MVRKEENVGVRIKWEIISIIWFADGSALVTDNDYGKDGRNIEKNLKINEMETKIMVCDKNEDNIVKVYSKIKVK